MATRPRTKTRVGAVDFDKRMTRWGERVVINTNQGVKDLASGIVNNLISNTPKLTGQASANWQVGINRTPTDFKEGATDYNAARMQALKTIESRKAREVINIVNNTPYIYLLNAGSSTQAPAGFIEKAMVAARAHLKRFKVLK